MELRVLRYFVAVADENSMSKAARKLHTTQSNISKQISNLENELGCSLFIRNGSHISITKEGLMLKDKAEKLLEFADETKAEFLAITKGDEV